MSNLRYALRQLFRNPALSLAIITTVALGIGGTTAIFTVVHAVLLKPLAYHDPDRLVILPKGATPIRYEEFLAANHSFAALGAYAGGQDQLSFSGRGEPEVLKAARVSANFLDILGVRPLLGRSFFASEDGEGGSNAVMLSAALWDRRFNSDPRILGQSIALDGSGYTVIGILPPRFQFPLDRTDIWITHADQWLRIPRRMQLISPTLHLFGRLKPGVTLAAADAEIQVLQHNYDLAHPGTLDANRQPPPHLIRLKDSLVQDISSKLWMLFGAVGLVLLLVCSNIASLLLVRASARSYEFAVRAAIGAGRLRIIVQLIVESLVYSVIGGALGLGLAFWSLTLLKKLPGLDLPRSADVHLDLTVLAFALLVSMVAGILFGVAPSLTAARVDLNQVLRASGEGTTFAVGRHRFLRISLRSVLISAQVAISIFLLIGAVLLIRSLANVYRVDPGFEASNLLTMGLSPSPVRYDTDPKRAAFYQQIVDSVQTVPGVQGAAITRTVPMTSYALSPVQVAERELLPLNKRPLTALQSVTPGFFATMKIPILRGRDITPSDRAESQPVAVISESMARLFWPQYPAGPDPLGQHIVLGTHPEHIEVIGIAADIHQAGLDVKANAEMYMPVAQQPPVPAMLAIRTNNDPLPVVGAIRSRICSIDPDQAVSDVATMSEVIDESEGQLRTMMDLLALFAAIATLIAIVGLYGFTAYAVEQREKEIGIRRALGANRANVLSLVLRQSLRLIAVGCAVGVAGAIALNRLLQDLLFHVKGTDARMYATAAIIFLGIAAAASYLAARRAASIDPLIVIRSGR